VVARLLDKNLTAPAPNTLSLKALKSRYYQGDLVTVRGGDVANLTDADLGSQLVDLTDLPLGELRNLTSSALVEALENIYALAAFNTGNELQDQRT
jgi:FXSXX-COOH protein